VPPSGTPAHLQRSNQAATSATKGAMHILQLPSAAKH
jgi:hypothetical protein